MVLKTPATFWRSPRSPSGAFHSRGMRFSCRNSCGLVSFRITPVFRPGLNCARYTVLDHFDGPFDTVADRDFDAVGVGARADVLDEIGKVHAMRRRVVGDHHSANADLGPEQVEVLLRRGLV